jgi:hypothetical protein
MKAGIIGGLIAAILVGWICGTQIQVRRDRAELLQTCQDSVLKIDIFNHYVECKQGQKLEIRGDIALCTCTEVRK